MPVDVPVTLYNAGPATPARVAQMGKVIRALGTTIQPGGPDADPRLRGGVLVIVEAIGYGDLPPIPGCQLYRDRVHGPSQGQSHANVAVYVHRSLPWKRMTWVDEVLPWPRTDHPGAHPPRSSQRHRIGAVDLWAGHAPPTGPGTGPAREEWYDGVGDRVAPWTQADWAARGKVWRQAARLRPRTVVADFNPADDQNPEALAHRVGGAVVGDLGPDRAVIRGCYAAHVRYRPTVAGVRLPTDHEHGALTFYLRIPRWALPKA